MTGASSTIGQALIQSEQITFDHIIAHCSKNADKLEPLREKLGAKLTVIQADFSSEEETLRMTEELISRDLVPTDIVHLPFGRFELKQFSNSEHWDSNRMRQRRYLLLLPQ